VLLTHGHYLDAHLEGSFPNRLQARATRTIGGVNGDARLDEQDYEAVIVPLTELLFTVAQMPRGCAVQKAFHHQFDRIGKLLRLASHLPRRQRSEDALPAFAKAAANLGWDRQADKIVFAHSHKPLDGVRHGGARFWNTGSWIYEPTLGSFDSYRGYLERGWPGTVVLVDTERDEPELIELLADQNPLNGGAPRPGELLREEPDMFRARGERYAARARGTAANRPART
jgi:hypothetical protein